MGAVDDEGHNWVRRRGRRKTEWVPLRKSVAYLFRYREIPTSFPLSDNSKTQSAQVSRLLHRLHVYGLVAKIPRSRRWRVSAFGYRIMSASLQLRQTFPGLHAKAAA